MPQKKYRTGTRTVIVALPRAVYSELAMRAKLEGQEISTRASELLEWAIDKSQEIEAFSRLTERLKR